MIQINFANAATEILRKDTSVIGLAVGGSWLTNDLDEFSDLDLILVTKELVSNNKNKMLAYAKSLGQLLTGFTGEHVGEPRVLICLYDHPLIHVDIKFLVLEEFTKRVEQPTILLDTDHQLQTIIEQTAASFPYPDYQWMEDSFWIWVHYALLKIGRGELMEAFDFLSFLRMQILGPLTLIKNNQLPRAVRKIETQTTAEDYNAIKATLPSYNKPSIIKSLEHSVTLYKRLRAAIFSNDLQLHHQTELAVMKYFETIKKRS